MKLARTRLTLDPLLRQLRHRLIDALHPKRQVPQPVRLRARPLRMPLHDKELQLAVSHRKIDLPVIPLRPVILPDHRKPELLTIKLQRRRLI